MVRVMVILMVMGMSSSWVVMAVFIHVFDVCLLGSAQVKDLLRCCHHVLCVQLSVVV